MSSIDGHKHKKSLRQKLDSLSKEKSKDKGEEAVLVDAPVISRHTASSPTLLSLSNQIRIWGCKDVSEGALTAAPAAASWQESNVFCQKSSGGEKKQV